MTPEPVATVTAWARGLPADHRVVLRCAAAGPSQTTPVPDQQTVEVRWAACLRGLSPGPLAELVAAAPRLVLDLAACSSAEAGAGPVGRAEADAVRFLRPMLAELGAHGRLQTTQVGARSVGDPGHASPNSHDSHDSPDQDASRRRSERRRRVGRRISRDPVVARGSGRPAASSLDALPVGRRALFSWAAPRSATGADGATAVEQLPPPAGDGHGEAADQVRLARALQEIRRQVREAGFPAPGRAPAALTGDPRPVTPSTPSQPPPPSSLPASSPSQPQHQPPSASPYPSPRSRELVSEGCTTCGTCVRSCPTAALSLSPTPGTSNTVALELDPAACIGCERCLALCPVQALTDHGPLSWVDLARMPTTVLQRVQVKDCERCRAPFGGEGALCQVCQMRRTKPFGSWLPPGYVAPRVYAARQPDSAKPDSVTGLQEEVRPDDLGDR